MKKSDLTQELITALRAGYSYSLSQLLPDPDPILAKLGNRDEIYRSVLADAKVTACVEQRKAGCLSMVWDLLGDDANAKQTEVIKRALDRLDMPRIISEILDAFLWGFQPLEVVWGYDQDGYTVPVKVEGRPASWFSFSAGNELLFRSREHPMGESLKPYKCLVAQYHPSYTNPYGEKCLPKCFWPVTFKKSGWRWWVTSTEKFGSPFVIGKVPRGTDSKEIDQLSESLEALVQNVTAVLPNDTAIELMDGKNSADNPHESLIDKCNNEIALAILGQTLTTEVGDTGSYAASKTHDNVRNDIVSSDKRMVEQVLQTLVDWVYELNWGQGTVPKFSIWQEDDVDRALAERDKIISELGFQFSKSYMIKAYGFSEDDLDRKEDSAPGAEFAEAPLKAAKTGVKKGNKKPFSVDEYDLDAKKLSEFGKALLTQIVNLIDDSSSFEEVRKRLFKLYPKMDTAELEDSLARAFYIAHVEGRRS